MSGPFAELVASEPPRAGLDGEGRFGLVAGERMLRVALDGEMAARRGTLVAQRGEVDVTYGGAGVGGFLRKAVTGEGPELMRVAGRGEVWFADGGSHLALVALDGGSGGGLVVNARALVALEGGLAHRIERASRGFGTLVAGGLSATTVRGRGSVCLASVGRPTVLSTDEPILVAAQAAVCWTEGVRFEVRTTLSPGAFIGRGSAGAVQLHLHGAGGSVVVQAGEPRWPAPTPSAP